MSISCIHGHPLKVTVVDCIRLKDTEWLCRLGPYVCLEYDSTKFRTRNCIEGGLNPIFQEKFGFTLIEGLRELHLAVWNSNTINLEAFIGSGRIQLQKVLSQGYDDSSWPLQTETGRHAGEVRLIMHYATTNRPAAYHATYAPSYVTTLSAPPVFVYSTPPPATATYAPPVPYGPPATAGPYASPAKRIPVRQPIFLSMLNSHHHQVTLSTINPIQLRFTHHLLVVHRMALRYLLLEHRLALPKYNHHSVSASAKMLCSIHTPIISSESIPRKPFFEQHTW